MKGLVREDTYTNDGHGQRYGGGLLAVGGELGGGRQRGENWDNCNRIKNKTFFKMMLSLKKPFSLGAGYSFRGSFSSHHLSNSPLSFTRSSHLGEVTEWREFWRGVGHFSNCICAMD